MEAYTVKVKRVLEKLVDENNDQSPPELNLELLQTMSPYFADAATNATTFHNGLQHLLCDAMKSRLLDCGWKDQIKLECGKAIIKHTTPNGLDLKEVINDVTPVARSSIPIEVKKHVVALLQDALMKELQEVDGSP